MELKSLSFLYKKFANSAFALSKIGEKMMTLCERFSLVLYSLSSIDQYGSYSDINLGIESLKLLVEMCHLNDGIKAKTDWKSF